MSKESLQRRPILTIWLTAAFSTLASCATVSSIESPDSENGARGMIYRMPLKWVRITLTVKDGNRSVTAEPTPAFGDPSRIYVAKFTRSLIANDDFTLNVDANGLLQTDQTFVTESQLAAGLSKLAEQAGRLTMRTNSGRSTKPGEGKSPPSPCDADGVYLWDIDPEATKTDNNEYAAPLACKVHVSIHRIGGSVATLTTAPVKSGTSESGLFYRQALAYSVLAYEESEDSPSLKATQVMSLPTSASPVGFVPISRTLFAKNTSTITFSDGMPTKLMVDQDSEWLGLATLPMTLINGYVQGIRGGLKDRRETLEDQVRYLDAVSKAKAQEAKTAACLKELSKESPDNEQVKTLCGTPNTAAAP